jgi:hypothetical protein
MLEEMSLYNDHRRGRAGITVLMTVLEDVETIDVQMIVEV